MRYASLFLFPIVVLLGACSIEDRIERREDRLLGTWQIDKATFKDDNALFGSNVTNEFRGDVVTFFPDYTLLYQTGVGTLFDGYWAISAVRDLDDDTEFTLDADFFDFTGRPDFQWLGTINRLTGNSLNITVFERGGVLQLRWDKL
ncbi:hypothetical protein CLV84_1650 [Neolewinella xylanilytica]|uniref:Lipocalin-like protein n=1 Tax=Neolewinella xylanilytica TaxID=1514080 RepID=A0A2S6IB01_9BACT|nr:hypothetical protein [Neolewinella xylanilytica]PPK88680.1 hypothetical protein CLV84_1650 [Neolewinella xylanilytica]